MTARGPDYGPGSESLARRYREDGESVPRSRCELSKPACIADGAVQSAASYTHVWWRFMTRDCS